MKTPFKRPWLDGQISMNQHLRWALRHKTFTLLVALAVFVGSMSLIRFVGTDFMPESDESRITGFG
jgi:multidrug efflux pump subunit AcrB